MHVYTDERNRIPADAVVDCSPRIPSNELARAINRPLIVVGDAVAARSVGDAIREGRAAALSLAPVSGPQPQAVSR